MREAKALSLRKRGFLAAAGALTMLGIGTGCSNNECALDKSIRRDDARCVPCATNPSILADNTTCTGPVQMCATNPAIPASSPDCNTGPTNADDIKDIKGSITNPQDPNWLPLDSTPSPDGETIYAIAITGIRTENVQSEVIRAGICGADKRTLASGFDSPVAIVVSTDNSTLYVADIGASGADGSLDDTGVIYSVGTGAAGTKTALEGTRGYQPRAMDLVKMNGKDVLFFVGNSKGLHKPGLFKVELPGGTVTSVVEGDPFRDPSGLAVRVENDAVKSIFVADAVGFYGVGSAIIKVDGTTPTVWATSVRLGYPAGIALSKSGQTLYVSALAGEKNQSVVHTFDSSAVPTETNPLVPKTTYTSSGLELNSESAGLHRAHDTGRMSWAGEKTVYSLGTVGSPLPQTCAGAPQ